MINVSISLSKTAKHFSKLAIALGLMLQNGFAMENPEAVYHSEKSSIIEMKNALSDSLHADDGSGNSKDEKEESRVVYSPTIHTVYSHYHSGTQYAFASRIGADGKIELQTHQIIGLDDRPFNIGLEYQYRYYKKKPVPSSSCGIAFGLNLMF